MKKRHLKPIVISTLLAVSFGASTVGTTFALFTDRADTNIQVTAGVVDIETTVKMVSYTDGNLLNDNDVDLSGETKYTTPKVGTVFELKGKDLEITNMVPGDKITLEVSLKNFSNVKTKYRLVATNNAGELAKALKVTSTGGTTVWTDLAASNDLVNGQAVETAKVTIEFVNHDEGEILSKEDAAARDNKFMGKTVTYHLGYEVVQGNANVVDSEPTGFNAYEEVVKPTAKVGEQGYVWEKTVANGDVKLAGETAFNDPITVSVGTQVENANFTFAGGSETVSYDIHVDRNNDDHTDVDVRVLLEKDLDRVVIYHEEDDGSVEEVANTYDAATGYVTFKTNSFSPYHFVQVPKDDDMTWVSTAKELQDVIDDENGKSKIGLAADINASQVVLLNRDVKLYGFGHSIFNTAKRVARITGGYEIEAYNVNFVSTCTAPDGDIRGISIDSAASNAKLKLDGCLVSASFYAINVVPGANNLEINITNGSVAGGWAALNLYCSNSKINVSDSKLKGLNDKGENSWNNFNTVTFDGDCHKKSNEEIGKAGSNNVLTITNSTVVAATESKNIQHSIGVQYGALNNRIVIDDKSKVVNGDGVAYENILDTVHVGWYCNYKVVDGEATWEYYNPNETFIINGEETVIVSPLIH